MSRSVWDFPRPPAVEPVGATVRVDFGGATIVETDDALQVLETSHPPTVYVPPAAVAAGVLSSPTGRRSFCEFKGFAVYHHVLGADGRTEQDGAWSYPSPTAGYEALRDHVAFYPGRMDACWIGGERVDAQPGDFYGGWITSAVTGPFKGGAGTAGW
jgi:uncharacterized protein (DUF427 family)